jgi:hypothetical protein
VSLTNVWVATQSDGIIRADQITGVDAHQTPAFSGKPARWLLDIVIAVPIGSGTREEWALTAAHRTVIQTAQDPGGAPAALARLLAQLDHGNAAGIITTSTRADTPSPKGEELATESGPVRFQFVPFDQPAPGRHTSTEYL